MPRVSNTTRSFVWSFLEQSGSKAILMLVQIVLARLLSPDAFGILAILLVVTQIADSIAQSGLGMALIQKSDSSAKSYSTGWWLSLSFAVILYAVVFLLAPAIAVFYQMPDLVMYLRVLGLVVIANSVNSIQRSYLQRSMDFESIFKASSFAACLSGLIGIALAVVGFGVWSLISQSLLQSVFTCIIMLAQVSWRPSFVFDFKEARELFGYGWKICVTGILNVLYSGVSELVIGRACSVSELGLYSQGRKYPQAAIGVLGNSAANVLFPLFSSIKNDPEELRKRLRETLMLGSFIIVPVSFLFAVVAEPLVVLLLTEKWLPCVLIFQLACISNSALMLQLVNLRAYMALGDSGLYMKLQIIKVLLGVGTICGVALITRNIYATAIATCISSLFAVLVVDMMPAKRLHGYSATSQLLDVAKFFLLSISASAIAALIGLLGFPRLQDLLLRCTVFVFVYLVGAKLFRFEELGEVLELVSCLVGRKAR